MVLVNTLTVEAINTALIALQRGQSIVVGGEKPGTTVNNITISNGGGGSGGSGLDFTPQITALDKRVGLLEKAEELLRQENERQNERLDALEGLGITDFYFDDTSRELTIELANGEVFDTEVTSESFSMEVVNGELIIRIGEQVHTVTLPMGSQADWTQTDSTQPDFIKHKIPIWITQGSADDNMSPIDSVTDGSMRPVTSNAVYDKHYLTSADITNQVTVDNMQSVSSNAVAQALTQKNAVIKYKEVTLNNFTIGNTGYTNIEPSIPSGMNNFLFCLLWNYGTSTQHYSFDVNADGRYVRGKAGDTIDYLILRYYYTE